jgi:hypothetical protein
MQASEILYAIIKKPPFKIYYHSNTYFKKINTGEEISSKRPPCLKGAGISAGNDRGILFSLRHFVTPPSSKGGY